MKKKNEIKDELQGLSPFLADIKKENAFKVPKDYFKKLPDEVLKQVQVSSNTTEQSTQASWLDHLIENIAILFQPRYAVGFATALILVVAAVYFIQKPTDEYLGSSGQLSEYVEENIDEFDAELLWEASVFEADENFNDETENETSSDDYLEEIIYELNDDELEMLL